MTHRLLAGLTAALAAVLVLCTWTEPSYAQGKGKGKLRPPSRPTPYWEDGHVRLGPIPGEKGVWSGMAGTTLENGNRNVNPQNLPVNLKVEDVPFQPWARAMFNLRAERLQADDPHVRCKPSGGPRLYHTPYGFEFVDFPEQKRVYAMGVGGPHTWRLIYTDGRPHPQDLDPSFYGHAVGKWEGDALVVDTVGFNERFWFSREGPPHTEQLHLTEKFQRIDHDDLRYEVTIDDPGAYTKPWVGGWMIPWTSNQEMYEYMCQENNRDVRHMYGGER